MSNVLVTGADGFIGSHLVEELTLSGHSVRAMSQYNSFGSAGWLETLPPEVLGHVEIISGDIRDPEFCRRAISGTSDIIHLAALIGIPYSYVAPDSYIQTNVTGTLNLLNAAREFQVSRFIHTSTSEVYGSAQFVPITESHPLVGQSPYSASKIAADQLAHSYWASFGLPVTTIRPFNTYGPRQSQRAVIPTIIGQALTGAQKIVLGETSTTRDFTFVKDTARAFAQALRAKDCVGEVINLGTGFEVSVSTIVELIAEVAGRDLPVESTLERVRPANSEVQRLLSDNSKARNLLGWEPELNGLASLRDGLAKTFEWFSSRLGNDFKVTGKYVI